MTYDHSLLIRKKGGTDVTDILGFGYAVQEIPWPEIEAQDVAAREWPGEDGEDAFVPPVLKMKAYDLEVTLVFKGEPGACNPAYLSLVSFLTGISDNVAEFDLYDPHNRRGYGSVRFKSAKPDTTHFDSSGDYQKIKVTFRVADPLASVILTKD